MRAFCMTNRGLVFDKNYPVPDIGTDEALVRVLLAGVCSTDLEISKGYFGFRGVLGHEFVGVVERADSPEWLGKRIVSSINFVQDRDADFYRLGREHHPRRKVLGILGHDGAMADYVRVPLANLLEVPESVSDRAAVFAEPLAAALRIRQQIIIDPDKPAAVVGPGRLGLMIGLVLRQAGGQVTIFGRSEASLQLPAELGFATCLVDSYVGQHFDVVVDATGNPSGLETAIRLTRPTGALILKSTYTGCANIDLTPLVVNEIQVIGSRCGPFAPALRCMADQQIELERMIDAVYELEKAEDAFQHASQPGVRKVLLRIGESASGPGTK
jgi:threonine dehydrogenase-like Zn-dependent dehydrogenase